MSVERSRGLPLAPIIEIADFERTDAVGLTEKLNHRGAPFLKFPLNLSFKRPQNVYIQGVSKNATFFNWNISKMV